jgi:hypothetical protein
MTSSTSLTLTCGAISLHSSKALHRQNTIEYKIGEIFGEIKNKISSDYNLREIVDRFDELRFGSATEKHEMSSLYEDKIKNMGCRSPPPKLMDM